jgi:ATP-dependent Lon protease
MAIEIKIGSMNDEIINEDTDFIPLISTEEEHNMNKESMPEVIPILPLRNTVLFPGVVIPITVGRDKSIRLIQDANTSDKIIGVLAQKDSSIEDPVPGDLHRIGTMASILRMLKMPDGSTTVIIQGKRRFTVSEFIESDSYLKASIQPMPDIMPDKSDKDFEVLIRSVKDLALNIINIAPHIPSEAAFAIQNIDSPTFLINFISSNMNFEVKEKQSLLSEADFMERSRKVLKALTMELQMMEMKNEIHNKVKSDLDKQQREYFLHQQMKTIQDELGENPVEMEIKEMKEKAQTKKWNKEVGEVFKKELDRLERMNPSSAEFTVQMNYLENILELPWNDCSQTKIDLKKTQKILDRDHYGLEKVKERIIEYLAVMKLKKNLKSPILCLYGPPGVGKTSLGKSIAASLGRKYIRMSLGGVRDEAEIRGHRRTYIGAMPGRVLQNLKKAGKSNPVFVLDEIDKITRDLHGDPSSALLEVLDPEQNTTFHDHYIDLDYDLSKVLFIATANSLSTIQPALLDRMEIIEVNGYTQEEKLEIAKRHLIPKQLRENGVKSSQIGITDTLVERLIDKYTNESGVRGLEKTISKVIRHRAKQIAREEPYEKEIALDELNTILGPAYERSQYLSNEIPGVVTGLAWTRTGGDVLYIESSLTQGKGKLTLTGNLGSVMKESAVIALEYLKSHSKDLGLPQEVFDRWNVHIHVPEGATPKDGPSAGITMLTSIASVFTQRKVKAKLAMTGEITLRGAVLPVGGIREKLLAARRSGIVEILLSELNRKDVEEIKPHYLKGLKIQYVKNMQEVLDKALLKTKATNPIDVESILTKTLNQN